MDIRNVQKTGNMFYMYLPTNWCKKFAIDSDSKVEINTNSSGELIINPQPTEKKPRSIEINLDETDLEIINKIIVGCYINPASSFKINLKEVLDQTQLLMQKKLVSIELVEIEGKTIRCESSITIHEPELILKTIINKIKNMILVITKNYNKELIEKYEEEIDRNRILIEKSIITALTFAQQPKTKTINLYYISQISRDLERIADYLIQIDPKDLEFFEIVKKRIGVLGELVEMIFKNENFDIKKAIIFSKEVLSMEKFEINNLESYYKNRVREYLENISDTLIDIAITQKVE